MTRTVVVVVPPWPTLLLRRTGLVSWWFCIRQLKPNISIFTHRLMALKSMCGSRLCSIIDRFISLLAVMHIWVDVGLSGHSVTRSLVLLLVYPDTGTEPFNIVVRLNFRLWLNSGLMPLLYPLPQRWSMCVNDGSCAKFDNWVMGRAQSKRWPSWRDDKHQQQKQK